MKSLEKNKGIIIAIILLIFAISMYNIFLKSDVVIDPTAGENVGSDLVDLYNNLQVVTLNQDLFSTAIYQKLADFSTDVPLQPVGRTNPFDLIGR